MSVDLRGVPEWDLDQLEIVMDEPASWQLVIAGPGTGKTAVACQRIAFLVDEGVPPSRILLVSFTRTAVAELRDRIVMYAVAGDRARAVKISTVDSHAWSLRVGFDQERLPSVLGDESYDLNIERVTALFRERHPDLIGFMQRLEHFVIDEAQDVVGVRADLAIEMLRSLAPECGATILADPAQAIYGFTTDDEVGESSCVSLLAILESRSPRTLARRRLEQIHRVRRTELIEVFSRTRRELENTRADGYVDRIQAAIRGSSGGDQGAATYDDLVDMVGRCGGDSTLVLFRRRAEVLMASSFCSSVCVEHRLRMSGLPSITSAWVGWLLGESIRPIISRNDFGAIWAQQKARVSAPFEGQDVDDCWAALHRLAAGTRSDTMDLVQLRRLLARARPPVELTLPDLGTKGPILGTIHASKGREADVVVLLIPPTSHGTQESDDPDLVLEEGRVYYVGATRAREFLFVAANTTVPVNYLDSRRVYRCLQHNRVQMEIGRDGDVDRLAHLAWSTAPEVQEALARSVGTTVELRALCSSEEDYAWRLELQLRLPEHLTRCVEVGEMSQQFREDLSRIWRAVDADGRLKPPPYLPHLYLAAVTTIGLSDDEMAVVRAPFNQSGLALAPVVKGFSTFPFMFRRWGGNR